MDFSRYGEATEEWTSFMSAHPIIVQGWDKPDQSLTEMYTSGTNYRAAHDQLKLRASGVAGKFTTQDHKVPTRDGLSIPLRLYAPNSALP